MPPRRERVRGDPAGCWAGLLPWTVLVALALALAVWLLGP